MSDPGSPIIVYLTMGLSAVTTIVLISAKLRELLAPMFGWMRGGTMRKMRQLDELEDARVVDLTAQVKHLATRVEALEEEGARHRRLVLEHVMWDANAIVEAGKAGIQLTPPPPLLAY